jgi:hypothetical protein
MFLCSIIKGRNFEVVAKNNSIDLGRKKIEEDKTRDQKVVPALSDDRVHLSLYQNGDYLTAKQAREVISENSGYLVSIGYMSDLVSCGGVPEAKFFGRNIMYPYKDIKDIVVSSHNVGPKKRSDNEVKPGALRVRRLRERRRAAAVAESAGTLETEKSGD